RQVIHSTAALGKEKVESAAERIRGLNPDVQVITYTTRLDEANIDDIFAAWDVIVDATDNFATRYLIDQAATRAGKPE
ncbi:HesA/MoeB/ThiF family protein, partial [Streptococcus agalactiae]